MNFFLLQQICEPLVPQKLILGPFCLAWLSAARLYIRRAPGASLHAPQRRWPAELARIAVLEKVSKALYLGGQLLIGYGQKMASPAIVREARAFQATTAAAIKQATGAQ
jgi:hypothetical protein